MSSSQKIDEEIDEYDVDTYATMRVGKAKKAGRRRKKSENGLAIRVMALALRNKTNTDLH